MLVVDEVALGGVGLKDDLQTLSAGGDIDEQDAEGIEIERLPGGEHLTGVVHMVDIHHTETREPGGALLAPAACAARLGGGLVEGGLEDKGRQTALVLGVARRTELVDQLRTSGRADERIELCLVDGLGGMT